MLLIILGGQPRRWVHLNHLESPHPILYSWPTSVFESAGYSSLVLFLTKISISLLLNPVLFLAGEVLIFWG